MSAKWSEIEGVMKMVTILGCGYPDDNVYDIPFVEFEFDDIANADGCARSVFLSFDTDRGGTIEVTTMVFDYLDRKGIGVKMVCYNRRSGVATRRSASEESVRAWEREVENRSLRRRDNHNREAALERSYLETRRRSWDRREEERRMVNEQDPRSGRKGKAREGAEQSFDFSESPGGFFNSGFFR